MSSLLQFTATRSEQLLASLICIHVYCGIRPLVLQSEQLVKFSCASSKNKSQDWVKIALSYRQKQYWSTPLHHSGLVGIGQRFIIWKAFVVLLLVTSKTPCYQQETNRAATSFKRWDGSCFLAFRKQNSATYWEPLATMKGALVSEEFSCFMYVYNACKSAVYLFIRKREAFPNLYGKRKLFCLSVFRRRQKVEVFLTKKEESSFSWCATIKADDFQRISCGSYCISFRQGAT